MSPAKPSPTRLLTVDEAAAQFGCGRDLIYGFIADGDLDTVDIARRGAKQAKTRIRETALLALIEARTSNARRLRSA